MLKTLQRPTSMIAILKQVGGQHAHSIPFMKEITVKDTERVGLPLNTCFISKRSVTPLY